MLSSGLGVGMRARLCWVIFRGYSLSYISLWELGASTDSILVFFFVVTAMRAKDREFGRCEYCGADAAYTGNGRDRKADREWKKGDE